MDHKFILKDRQDGKTTEIIKRCADNGGYIVTVTRQDAHRILDQAREMGYDIPLPLSFREFIGGQYHARGVRKFHFDDVDLCLMSMTNVPIVTMTATKTEAGGE